MQLHIPIDQLKWINEMRQEKSQQTFIIQLIDKVMRQQETLATETTEDTHGNYKK